jgi:hypothetical protein
MRLGSISLTCEVGTGGGRCWWLTRESGRGPSDCTEGPECVACSAVMEGGTRGAYVVLKGVYSPFHSKVVERGEVALARLCVESVDVVRERVAPRVARCVSGDLPSGDAMKGSLNVCAKMKSFFDFLYGGAYSCMECKCDMEALCIGCASLGPGANRFLTPRGFTGPEHWFAGVTDAVGRVDDITGEWLSCWLSYLNRFDRYGLS